MAEAAAPFGPLRLRASLDVDVMSLHDEIAKQSRSLDRLCRHARDLAFEFQSLHVPKTIDALRSLRDRSREVGAGCPEELGKAAEMTGRLASLLLEQSATRDGHIADAVGRLTQVLTEVHSYRTWSKDFEIALSSYEIAKGRAKQAKARGEDLTEPDAQKRTTKRQCQAAGLAVVARMLSARGRLQGASVSAAVLLTEAYEDYVRSTLDSLAPIAASRVALAACNTAPPAEAQLELLFPGIFETSASQVSLSVSSSPSSPSPLSSSTSPNSSTNAAAFLPPPPTGLPPPPPSSPPHPPIEGQSPSHDGAAVLSPRWGSSSEPRVPRASDSSPLQSSLNDMRVSQSWGAKPSAATADGGGDLRTSQGWGARSGGSARPQGSARIQLGGAKADAEAARPPSPAPSPRGSSPQRTYSKALPPVPPSPSTRAAASGTGSGRPHNHPTERERSHGAAPAAVMALITNPGERKGSSTPGSDANSRHVFEAQKVAKAKLQSLMPGTLEVDMEARTISTYHAKKQTRKVYPADSLMKIQRSKVNPRKMKIYWTKKETPQRYHMMSQEDRERFIETSHWARHLVSAPPNTPFIPRLFAPLQEEINIWIGSWNMGNAGPPADLTQLEQWAPRNKYDLYVVAVQECDFEHAPGYSSCEEEWFTKMENHLGDGYVRLAGLSLLAIRLLIVIKKEHLGKITQVQKAKEATGIGGVYGNKGGVGVSFYFNETALAFVGAHLAARDERVKQRNDNYRDIVSGLRIAREPYSFATFCDYSFFCGDLNYRVTAARDKALDAIKNGRHEELLVEEQLNAERAQGNCFAEFKEGQIKFPPTYRYNRGDRTFSDEKMRTPSWCDRVLWRALPGLDVVQTSYTACSAMTTSDHNAISASFRLPTLLANVPHMHTPSRILISNLRVELTGEAIAPKPPTDPHLVWYCSLAEEAKSLRPLKRQASAGQVWGDDEPHALVPFVHNREWVHTRHVQVCVKDHRGEYGQTVISLQNVCDGRPVPFNARLLLRGRESGSIRGEIQFALDSSDRRKPSGTPNSLAQQPADEKCGYLLKQGATRKNWKRRWFECRNGTMTYTLNRDAKQQFGSFSVKGATVAEANQAVGKQHCISVTTPKRVWLLCCDSFDDMRGWLEHIKRQAQLPP